MSCSRDSLSGLQRGLTLIVVARICRVGPRVATLQVHRSIPLRRRAGAPPCLPLGRQPVVWPLEAAALALLLLAWHGKAHRRLPRLQGAQPEVIRAI